MAAIKFIKRTVALDGSSISETLPASFFNSESSAHTFIIAGSRDGETVDLSGAVSATFLNANDAVVVVSGSIVDGAAVVTLSNACYALSGRFTLSIDVAGATVYECQSRIKRRSSSTIYDPTGEFDVNTLAAEIVEMRSATADTEAATTAAQNATARVSQLDPVLGYAIGNLPMVWEQGMISSSGESSSQNFIRTTDYFVAVNGDTLAYDVPEGLNLQPYLYKSDKSYISGVGSLTGRGEYAISSTTAGYIRFRVNRSGGGAILPSVGYGIVATIKNNGKIYQDVSAAIADISVDVLDQAKLNNLDATLPVTWEQGTITTSGESDNSKFIRTVGYIDASTFGSVKFAYDDTVYAIRVFQYTAAKAYIMYNTVHGNGSVVYLRPTTAFIRIRVTYLADQTISPDAGSDVVTKIHGPRLPYVTPQMYGAVGDGVTDDTAAFQGAFSASRDVLIPFSSHEIYLITETITISGTGVKRCYGDGGNGYIYFDAQAGNPTGSLTTLRNTYLFRITTTQAFLFDNINVRSKTGTFDGVGKRIGSFLRANDNTTVDYDIKIRHCAISFFYRLVSFKGRGFALENSSVTSMQLFGTFDWDDQYDTNANHPANMDQRAIIIRGNRLHSYQSGGFVVNTGHAYGLVFSDNVLDVGRKYLFVANQEAWNWSITNNILLGYVDAMPVMEFKAGAKNLIVANNQFISDENFWLATPGNPTNWLVVEGTLSASVISTNVFKNSSKSLMHLDTVEHTAISNNIFQGPGHVVSNAAEDSEDIDPGDEEPDDSGTESAVACIYIETAIDDSAIVGNVAKYDGSTGNLLALAATATQSGVVNIGNVG